MVMMGGLKEVLFCGVQGSILHGHHQTFASPRPSSGDLVDYQTTAGLLLVHFDGVTFLHLQRRRCVVLVDGRSVETKADDLHRQTLRRFEKLKTFSSFKKLKKTYSSVAVSVHQLAEWSVTFDLELHDSVVLSQDLQVDVLRLASLFVLQRERIIQREKHLERDITSKVCLTNTNKGGTHKHEAFVCLRGIFDLHPTSRRLTFGAQFWEARNFTKNRNVSIHEIKNEKYQRK